MDKMIQKQAEHTILNRHHTLQAQQTQCNKEIKETPTKHNNTHKKLRRTQDRNHTNKTNIRRDNNEQRTPTTKHTKN